MRRVPPVAHVLKQRPKPHKRYTSMYVRSRMPSEPGYFEWVRALAPATDASARRLGKMTRYQSEYWWILDRRDSRRWWKALARAKEQQAKLQAESRAA